MTIRFNLSAIKTNWLNFTKMETNTLYILSNLVLNILKITKAFSMFCFQFIHNIFLCYKRPKGNVFKGNQTSKVEVVCETHKIHPVVVEHSLFRVAERHKMTAPRGERNARKECLRVQVDGTRVGELGHGIASSVRLHSLFSCYVSVCVLPIGTADFRANAGSMDLWPENGNGPKTTPGLDPGHTRTRL